MYGKFSLEFHYQDLNIIFLPLVMKYDLPYLRANCVRKR